MSLNEILREVDKLSDFERKELIEFLLEVDEQDKKIEAAGNKEQIKTAFDLMPDLMGNLCGKHDSGITDLASNKKHLEGLGRD